MMFIKGHFLSFPKITEKEERRGIESYLNRNKLIKIDTTNDKNNLFMEEINYFFFLVPCDDRQCIEIESKTKIYPLPLCVTLFSKNISKSDENF